MDSYQATNPLWDLAQPHNFSQINDEDFLALLEKEFPDGAAFQNGLGVGSINPQSITPFTLPALSPTSDSSPSPPQSNQEGSSRSQSEKPLEKPEHDDALKRKASDDDFEQGPSPKSQHTLADSRKNTSRRRSSGEKDESRLLKRKEQNRAAQRAFRERKEKHVKDLEDQVAALQAQNDRANTENENLRDLLGRLQNENHALKQTSFTFTAPPPNSIPSTSSLLQDSLQSVPGIPAKPSEPGPSFPLEPIDWTSLQSFDPSVLDLLDQAPQHTATEGATQMDWQSQELPFTILRNPQFMSFADPNPPTDSNLFAFDSQSPVYAALPSPSVNLGSPLDDLFKTSSYPQISNPFDISLFTPSIGSLSPVSHTVTPPAMPSFARTPSSSSSSFSSLSHGLPGVEAEKEHKDCPKSKEELSKLIKDQGSSPFTMAPHSPMIRKETDGLQTPSVGCKGANFPMTEKSDRNIEVMAAWKRITADPKFKHIDMNELCTEFSNKARCDGTKVVLEPTGVREIIENLAARRSSQQFVM